MDTERLSPELFRIIYDEDTKRLLKLPHDRKVKITIIPAGDRDTNPPIRRVQRLLDTLEPGDNINFFPPILVMGTIVAPKGVNIEGLSDSRNYPRYQVVYSDLP